MGSRSDTSEADKVVKLYIKEVEDKNRKPNDFIFITPFVKKNPLMDTICLKIREYWENVNPETNDYIEYCIFHKSEDGKSIMPLEKYDAQCMSMGFLVDEQTPMIWRGPMVISALKTMTQKVLWKNRDIIIVDMPPGTGDTQLTFAQEVKVDGAIIVSTPQDLALLDVKRGIQMFDKTGVKILGLIDNMSYFKGDDDKKYKIFGESGVEETAKKFNKEFLGHLPIHQDLRSSADKGKPLTYSDPDHEVSKLFKNIAEKIKQSFL